VDVKARIALPFPIRATSAGAGGAQWSISGEARLTGLHGWRLPARGPPIPRSISPSMQHGVWEKPARESRSSSSKCGNSHLPGRRRIGLGARLHPELHLNSSSVVRGCHVVVSSASPGCAGESGSRRDTWRRRSSWGWPLQLEQGAFASAWRKTHGASLPSPLKSAHQRQRFSRSIGFCPDGDSHLRAYCRREIRSGFSGRRVRELIHDARNDFPGRLRHIPLASQLEFLDRGRDAWRRELAGPFRGAGSPFECELDRCGRTRREMRAVHSAPSPATIWLARSILATSTSLQPTSTSRCVCPTHTWNLLNRSER